MSPREKKLLILFATAGFLVLNFLGFKFYQSKRLDVELQRNLARQKLDAAELFRSNSQQIAGEMEWLAKHEPEPAADQDVKTQLQQFCSREATTAGLTLKSQVPQPTDTTAGRYFHRAKIQFVVNGTEKALYAWFDRLNAPDQLRMTTNIRLLPDAKDDTQIDCTATVEQWFVPLPPSA